MMMSAVFYLEFPGTPWARHPLLFVDLSIENANANANMEHVVDLTGVVADAS